ncbi:MAG: hypothetical protein WCG25_06820 [bacterium]
MLSCISIIIRLSIIHHNSAFINMFSMFHVHISILKLFSLKYGIYSISE